jgi:hypothetical protein
MWQKIGGSINYILANGQNMAIASIEASELTEAQYQSFRGVGYIIADGRDVTGSAYHTITGNANVPDLRGRFLRMRDYTAGRNPDGDQQPGTIQSDDNRSHFHTVSIDVFGFFAAQWDPTINVNTTTPGSKHVLPSPTQYASISLAILNEGSADGRPKAITMNWFIRIN